MPLLPAIELQTADGAAAASVIVLHGLGADGNDFVPFTGEIDLSAIGPVRWVFPHAPERPVTVNNGYVMRAWYDIVGADLLRRADEAGLRESERLVAELIDREIARGVPASRIVLAGFSQGCAMTLMAGLRYPQRLAGLVGLSGYLPLSHLAEAERHAANADTPVFLAHGTHDPIVPFAGGESSRDTLQAMGHPVEWHAYPMPHSVCAEEVADLEAWLQKRLAA